MRVLRNVVVGLVGAVAIVWGAGAAEVYRATDLPLRAGVGGDRKINVEGIPEHRLLKLVLDLDIEVPPQANPNDHWSQDAISSDVLRITADGRTIFSASFSDSFRAQSFPDALGGFDYPGRSSSEGRCVSGGQRYQFELIFPHGGDSLELCFDWLRIDPVDLASIRRNVNRHYVFLDGEEAFVIRGLSIESVEPLVADQKSARVLLDQIGGVDPEVAQVALQELVRGGDAILPFARRRIARADVDPDMEDALQRVLLGLDADSFPARLKARADLEKLGTAVLPSLDGAIAAESSAEVRLHLQQAKGGLLRRLAAEKQLLSNRLHPVLEMLGTEEAKKTADVLLPVKRLVFYEPDRLTAMKEMEEELGQVLGEQFDAGDTEIGDLPPLPEPAAFDMSIVPDFRLRPD